MPGDRGRDLLLFEDLVGRHVDLVYHVALSWTGDPGEAEDVTQVACIKAWRAFDRFEAGTNFKAWILKILRNAFIDARRAAGRRPESCSLDDLAGEEPAAAAPPPRVIDIDTKEVFYDLFGDEIARLLRRLPPEFEVAVLLCDVEDLSYAEIAEVLEVPIGTVRSRIHRGRAMLSDLLRDYARGLGYLQERQA